MTSNLDIQKVNILKGIRGNMLDLAVYTLKMFIIAAGINLVIFGGLSTIESHHNSQLEKLLLNNPILINSQINQKNYPINPLYNPLYYNLQKQND